MREYIFRIDSTEVVGTIYDKEASIEMRDTIKGIYSDVHAGRYKT